MQKDMQEHLKHSLIPQKVVTTTIIMVETTMETAEMAMVTVEMVSVVIAVDSTTLDTAQTTPMVVETITSDPTTFHATTTTITTEIVTITTQILTKISVSIATLLIEDQHQWCLEMFKVATVNSKAPATFVVLMVTKLVSVTNEKCSNEITTATTTTIIVKASK